MIAAGILLALWAIGISLVVVLHQRLYAAYLWRKLERGEELFPE